jgi:hypothetical protein
MNPLGNRARAEELARLLEGAVAGPASATGGYATLATRLRTVAPALDDAFVPRAEFRAALRQRLLAVAAVHGGAVEAPAAPQGGALEAAVAWSRTWKAQRRIAAAAGAMAVVVGFTGVGIASTRSLPGQPFYGVKRAVESLQLDLADGDTAKGTKHLEFASTRLREVRALASGRSELAAGSPGTPLAGGSAFGGSVSERIRTTLEDFDSETRSGKVLLERAYRRTGKTEPLKVLSTFSTQQQHTLTALLPDLPVGATAAAQSSLDLLTSVGTTADQLLAIGTCSAACDPSGAGPLLPVQPAPSPGTSASPGTDDNGVPPCGCGQPAPTPEPTTEPSPEDTGTPTPEPTPEPSSTPSPSPSPTPSPTPLLPIPLPLPTILPTDWPTVLPTDLPLPLPTITPLLQLDAREP